MDDGLVGKVVTAGGASVSSGGRSTRKCVTGVTVIACAPTRRAVEKPMDEQRDARIVYVLVAVNALVAIVCFGLLKSTADVDTSWSLGGAIAGFAVTFTITFAP